MVTTKEAMEGIAVQGILGDMITNSLEIITRKLLDRALAGKRDLQSRAASNKTLAFLGKIVPRNWVAAGIAGVGAKRSASGRIRRHKAQTP